MAQLTINGITVPVSADGFQAETMEIGERSRALDGRSLATIRAYKQKWSGNLISYDTAQALALRGLIAGRGHTWDFTNTSGLYSAKGLGPDTGHNATQAGSGGEYWVSIATGGSALWRASPGSAWTLALLTGATGSWTSYVFRYDGARWVDGVRNDAALPAWVTVSTTSLTLKGDAGAARKFRNVVCLPYPIPLDNAEWVTSLVGSWAPSYPTPWIWAAGDLIATSGTVTCRGQASQARLTNRGALNHRQDVAFSLEEF